MVWLCQMFIIIFCCVLIKCPHHLFQRDWTQHLPTSVITIWGPFSSTTKSEQNVLFEEKWSPFCLICVLFSVYTKWDMEDCSCDETINKNLKQSREDISASEEGRVPQRHQDDDGEKIKKKEGQTCLYLDRMFCYLRCCSSVDQNRKYVFLRTLRIRGWSW